MESREGLESLKTPQLFLFVSCSSSEFLLPEQLSPGACDVSEQNLAVVTSPNRPSERKPSKETGLVNIIYVGETEIQKKSTAFFLPSVLKHLICLYRENKAAVMCPVSTIKKCSVSLVLKSNSTQLIKCSLDT